jgi:hypothetical protein
MGALWALVSMAPPTQPSPSTATAAAMPAGRQTILAIFANDPRTSHLRAGVLSEGRAAAANVAVDVTPYRRARDLPQTTCDG